MYPITLSNGSRDFSSNIILVKVNRNLLNPLGLLFYDSSVAAAAATFRRHCSKAGDHNNPSSRHNGDTSDDSIRDLDGGNFPRWASVRCADRGTSRRFRSVYGRRDGHFSGRNGRDVCISWRGARRGVRAWVCVGSWGRSYWKNLLDWLAKCSRRDQVFDLGSTIIYSNGRSGLRGFKDHSQGSSVVTHSPAFFSSGTS